MTKNEENGGGPRLPPEFVRMRPKEAFNVLFPNYPFDMLPEIDVHNLPRIPVEFVVQMYLEGVALFRAKEAGRGYARRIDLPYFDRTTARVLLAPAFKPFADLPKPHEIRDVIAPNEEIGGGIQQVFGAPHPKALEISTDITAPINPGYRSMSANIVGICRKFDHKPTGLLVYLSGSRNPVHQKERVQVGIGRPTLVPVYS